MTTYMVRVIERDTGREHFVKVIARNRKQASKKANVSRTFYNVNGAYTTIEHARLYFKHNYDWIIKPNEFDRLSPSETDWDRINPYIRKRAKKLALESVNLSTRKLVMK